MRIAIIVVAAGQGSRFGHSVPKAFVSLRGRTLLERSIRAMAAVPGVEAICPVVPPDAVDRFDALDLADLRDRVMAPVVGGLERQDSVAAGLAALDESFDLIGVHDAARCLVRPAEVERVVIRAAETGAAILATRVRDTIKEVEGKVIVGSPSREGLWAAQTPQVFRAQWLRDAFAHAERGGFRGTDDAELVALVGHVVHVVEGSDQNLKLTHPGDLAVAEAWLAQHEPGTAAVPSAAEGAR